MTNDSDTAEDGVYQNDDLTTDDLLSTVGVGKLMAVDIGECVWIPVSMVRGDNFRAVKVEVKERASVGDYEEENAIEPWHEDIERLYGRTEINTVDCCNSRERDTEELAGGEDQ